MFIKNTRNKGENFRKCTLWKYGVYRLGGKKETEFREDFARRSYGYIYLQQTGWLN
jgi:hypothetical protein